MRTLFTVGLAAFLWLCALAHGQGLQATSTIQTPATSSHFVIGPLTSSATASDSPLLTVSVQMVGVRGRSQTFGSGTVIQSDPCLILTAMHLMNGSEYTAHWTDGRKGAAKFLFGDRDGDIAVFHVASVTDKPAVAISSGTPRQSDLTWTIGGDHGDPLSERQGRILSVNRYVGKSNIESSARGVEGRSGGGVFNAQGELIGVISARDPSNNDATIATSCQSILDLLRRNRDKCPNGQCPAPAPQTPPAPAPAPAPAPPANPSKDLDELKARVKALEEALENLKLTPGRDGQAATIEIGIVRTVASDEPARVTNTGTATKAVLNFDIPQGEPGRDGEVNYEAIVVEVLKRMPKPNPTPQPSEKVHVVIVADKKADYWPRLSGEIQNAQGYISAIRIADPPDFSVPLPQLVVYHYGSPQYRSVGLRKVSDDLQRIVRGDFEPVKQPAP